MKIAKLELSKDFVAATAPLLFTFIAVFYTRSSVGTFFVLALGLIILEVFLVRKIAQSDFKKIYPYVLITCGAIGLAAAGILTIEKIALLKDAGHVTSCSLSPIVACSPVINSPEASVFTIPNPAFGILGFGLVIGVGMMLLAGADKLKSWFWQVFLLGTLLGLGSVGWLIYETLYDIGSICLYCTSAWVVTVATFVTTLKYVSEEGAINLSTKIKTVVERYPLEIIVTIYAVVIALILQRFWTYWMTII